jgi:hypothetical protein
MINYKLSNTTIVIFIIFIIILIISVLCIFYYISYKNNTKSTDNTIEGFNTLETSSQVDNVIHYGETSGTVYEEKTETLQLIRPNDGGDVSESPFIPIYKHIIVLKDTYVIKQIYLESLGASDKFRIGIKNKSRNKISFVSGLDLNIIERDGTFADNSNKFINMTVINASDTIYNKLYPLDIYGNDLVGDEIIIYNSTSTNNIKATIMGHLENEPFYKHPTYDTIQPNTIISTTNTTNSSDDKLNEAHGVTKLTFKSDYNIDNSTGKKIKVLFENNYSGNRFTFEGPLPDRSFIITPKFKSIFFHHTLLANTIIIKDGDADVEDSNISKLQGYMPSVIDINRFKLEYNLTDVRSSINPDDICPSLDQYMNDQLSSEIVIDAMEYQDKINMEKMKLSSNKDSMLTLLEQEEDIIKLEKMVKKINSLHQQRKHTTNALNTLQLRRQMDEVLKLRDVLNNRIALREQNTINIPVDINRVKYIEKVEDTDTQPNIDEFSDIPLDKSENMSI